MSKIIENFLKSASSEALNKELEWNKLELPSYDALVSFCADYFGDDDKKELEEYITNGTYDMYYFIVKNYIHEALKIDRAYWITKEMFIEGTVEHSYYKNFIEGQKRPWEK